MKSDIRWKQRFENFERSFLTFSRILEIESPNEAERMGLVQAFEIVFELSWKTLKDYLTEQGFQEKTPKGVLKLAFQNELVADGHHWMEALASRNETVHTYDDKMAEKLDKKIREIYAPMIRHLYDRLKKEYDNG